MGIVDIIVGISQYLPEIKKSEKEIPFSKKIMWTLVALIIFFILANIKLIGLDPNAASYASISAIQTLLASEMGTLITAGIGPIVMASIFLQLFVGAQILKINLQDPAGRSQFQALQKILAIVLCFVEALIYVVSGLLAPIGGVTLTNPVLWMVVLQIALGSLILLYLDELVSKYGIGSGISLFIAANVAGGIFWQVFMPPIASAINPALANGGRLWSTFTTGDISNLIPLLGVGLIFAVVVFAEGIHVNIPVTYGASGTGGRYPVKFLYVSNMPVILAMALFANVHLWALLVQKTGLPFITDFFNALSWATTIPSVGGQSLVLGILIQGINSITIAAIGQAVVFMALLVMSCVVFGWFWVQMGNQSTDAVAAQLERSGMQIPGFRRDKRVIEKVLLRYIPPITILGSIFVALLSGFGDLVLSGLSTGTGILLTVGIVYRLYEEIAKNQAETIARLLGKI